MENSIGPAQQSVELNVRLGLRKLPHSLSSGYSSQPYASKRIHSGLLRKRRLHGRAIQPYPIRRKKAKLLQQISPLEPPIEPEGRVGFVFCGRTLSVSRFSIALVGGTPKPPAQLEVFANFVRAHGLLDLGCKGNPYSWTNKRAGKDNIRERLDRALCSVDWRFLFDTVSVTQNPIFGSDHSSLIVTLFPIQEKGRKPFRFESMWTTHPGCLETVEKDFIDPILKQWDLAWLNQVLSADEVKAICLIPLPRYLQEDQKLQISLEHTLEEQEAALMAVTNPDPLIDPKSGFCSQTKIFHSLRPHVPLPSETLPLSAAEFAFSLLPNNSTFADTTTVLIDATSGHRISYSEFLNHVEILSVSLQSLIGLSRGDTAFILAPACLQVPILYFSLLSLGVVVSPANPISSKSEISHQIQLSKPVIAFATSATAQNLPSLRHRTILLDSPDFRSMMTIPSGNKLNRVDVKQSDSAAILYSSGTTGRVKGVLLTHRNFIALLAGFYSVRLENEEENSPHPVSLITVPLFHVFGLFMFVRAVAFAETLVLMEKFDFEGMLRAVEAYGVTYMPVSPPLVVAMAKLEVVRKYDLSSLLLVGCGGAPLGKEVSERFVARFPNVEIVQGYGLTETTGAAAKMVGPDECKRHGSVGRLTENMEAKIVDPVTGEALPPGQRGELWLRGPTNMKGYVEDDNATISTLDSEGWLKTGDLCYFDSDGYLFIVDRLKELIKYKAYQVPPAELEHLLQSHLEIADAAVIPYPDEEAGQIPMAFIVRKPGSNLSEAQVAPYKKIRRVSFINSIPRSPAGKILRRELIDSAVSGASARL
ncbi:hypothetical protein HHK36_025134 [Tetracentron sinense]|uniref:4-coumarate--CoA ligase n=1 Tax=Tetracentron sinense TaxID=13715 RepID=A0A834YRB6_TETSI|nr:hypothetical protein HHK36_025134 [Tetracentron sinense]